MIAVTGANGQLGRLVLKHIAGLTAEPVRALVRTPEKAGDLATDQVSVVKADYDDSTTLPAALEGVERLLLISGSEVGKRAPQHKAVIDAAKAAGVPFIVYTSLLNVPQSSLQLGVEHAETERMLRESGIAHAVLRNGWYRVHATAGYWYRLPHDDVVDKMLRLLVGEFEEQRFVESVDDES